MTTPLSGVPDQNAKWSSILWDSANSRTFAWEGSSTYGAAYIQLLDGSGSVVSSFGGGTQYTDGASTIAHPIGTMPVFDNAGTISKVSNSIGLPVNVLNSSIAVTGTFWQTTQPVSLASLPSLAAGTNTIGSVKITDGTNTLPIQAEGDSVATPKGTVLFGWDGTLVKALSIDSSRNLMVNVQNFAIGTYGNSDGTAANLTSGLAFSEGLLYNGTTWDRWRGDTTSGAWVNVKNSSIAVTGTFWQATQPVSVASGGIASGAIASGAIASGAAVSGAFADGSIVTLGAKTDAKSTATDGTSTSIVSILKEISAMEQAPASRAVTNAGTFAVQNTESTTLPSFTTAPDSVAIAASSSGDNTIISAPGAAKTIYVYAYSISFNGTVNAKFTDGASGTNKAGLFYGVANAGAANSVRPPYYLFKCSANTALVLNLSGATAVGGHVSYFVI